MGQRTPFPMGIMVEEELSLGLIGAAIGFSLCPWFWGWDAGCAAEGWGMGCPLSSLGITPLWVPQTPSIILFPSH